MSWITPITDRTVEDTRFARNNQGNEQNNKGALNHFDLNRIEGNFYHIVDRLKEKCISVDSEKRNFTEVTYEYKEYEEEKDKYTRLSYIEGTGTQYIDTGITVTEDTIITADFRLTNPYEAKSGERFFVFGDGKDTLFYWLKLGETFYFAATASGLFSDGNFPGDAIHSVNMYDRKVTLDGKSFSFYREKSDYGNLFLFSNNENNVGADITKMQLYKCRIYNGSELVRDFIPAKDGDGVACLYDDVSKTFFYNSGTGSFVASEELEENGTNKKRYEEVIKSAVTYTEWFEHNIPYLSEINRIRGNLNNLVMQFPFGIELPTFEPSSNLLYDEVNKWENIELEIRNALLRTELSYRFCGTFDCGGDVL